MSKDDFKGRACWYWDYKQKKWLGAKFHGVFDSRDGDEAGPVAAIEFESDGTMSSVAIHNVCFASVPPSRA